MKDFEFRTWEELCADLGREPTPEELEAEVRSRIEVMNEMADAQAEALFEELESLHVG